MIMLTRGAGDPDRIAHAVAVVRPSTLDEVRAALAEYAASGGTMIVDVTGGCSPG
jgi:nitrogen regulatory protein PII